MARGLTSLVAWIVIIFATLVKADVDPIVIKGSHFFYNTNGSEFFIRGVTYQPSLNSTSDAVDPLATLTCMRDIPFLSQLTTNVIRVSYIDPTQDHTACMAALQNSGIYVIVDLPGAVSINSTNPEWNFDIYDAWIQRIDAIAGHNNVLGFFAGKNIVTSSSNSPAAAFVKAGVRDLKAYINSTYSRAIPVGYELSLVNNYDIVALYMACDNSQEAIDFLGISDFDSCTNDSSSSFNLVSDEYSSYPVPVFIADYGCQDANASAREFEEVTYIYGNPMTDVVSGGIVFEYFEDEEDKGLVTVSGTQVTPLPDFTSYSSQIAKITPSSTSASNYTVTNTKLPSCPTEAAFSASPTLPPAVNKDVCTCMMGFLTCTAKPGLDSETVASVLEDICGSSAENCPGLYGNGSNGTYGAYSMCTSTERLSWALDYRHQNSESDCANDEYATPQNASFPWDCESVLEQAGEDGTGTITSYPTGTSEPTSTAGVYYGNSPESLSASTITGITVGSVVIFASVLAGSIWYFCKRKRGYVAQKVAAMEVRSESQPSEDADPPSGLRGGRRSVFSESSREMSILPPFQESYMGSWSQSELQSGPSENLGRESTVSERDAMISQAQRPVSLYSDFETGSLAISPSPMSSVKELPAFRHQQEDKSLASMKLLSPVVQTSPT